MNDLFQKIEDGIREIFPDIEDAEITMDMELGAIPDWDSMSAVNLQSYIEQQLSVTISQDILTEETTIRDLIALISDPDQLEATVSA